MMKKMIKLSLYSLLIFNLSNAVPIADLTDTLDSCDPVRGSGKKRKKKTYGDIEVEEIVRVYDGDTITVNIAHYPEVIGKSISVRLYGIDTPERRGVSDEEKKLALIARDFLIKMLNEAKKVELRNLRRDKYFRLLAEVYADNVSVGDRLIKAGLARPYFGGKKQPWFPEATKLGQDSFNILT